MCYFIPLCIVWFKRLRQIAKTWTINEITWNQFVVKHNQIYIYYSFKCNLLSNLSFLFQVSSFNSCNVTLTVGSQSKPKKCGIVLEKENICTTVLIYHIKADTWVTYIIYVDSVCYFSKSTLGVMSSQNTDLARPISWCVDYVSSNLLA
jgi:hypothetical protein